MAETKEFQERINKIIDEIDSKMSGVHDSDTTIIHLMEELGEISRQLYNKKIGRDKLNNENLAEEIADVIMLLNKLATIYNIDVETALNNKIKLLKKRHNL